MSMLIIKNDDGDSFGTKLKSYTISIDSEDELTLKLTTEDSDVIYQIRTDMRASDIYKIEKFIINELNDAYSGKKPFIVSEYLTRMYIYIGDIDLGEQGQFTASKIQ